MQYTREFLFCISNIPNNWYQSLPITKRNKIPRNCSFLKKKARKLQNYKQKKASKIRMARESSNFVQPTIPQFDGHYDHWAMFMEIFLRSKEYWNLIEHVIAAIRGERVQTMAQQKTHEEDTFILLNILLSNCHMLAIASVQICGAATATTRRL